MLVVLRKGRVVHVTAQATARTREENTTVLVCSATPFYAGFFSL